MSIDYKMNSIRFFPSLRKYGILPILKDGNCFYRAVSKVYYNDESFHLLLRRTMMDQLREDPEIYDASLVSVANANKRDRSSLPELSSLLPTIAANMLQISIYVYTVNEQGDLVKNTYMPKNGYPSQTIRLFQSCNTYDVLVK
jgi:hypothetical protein